MKVGELREDSVIALRKFANGEKIHVSTGIHGGLTHGYGKLSGNGYWEFQLPYNFALEVFPWMNDT